jgi:FkbM family methyltransferase
MVADRADRILAFESSAENVALMTKNVRLNALHEKIFPIAAAIGERSELQMSEYTKPHWSLEERGVYIKDTHRGERVRTRFNGYLPVYRLDDFPAPDHLKIDVDGAEGLVLAGAQQTLTTIKTLCLEWDEKSRDAVEPLLSSMTVVLDQESLEKGVRNTVLVR